MHPSFAAPLMKGTLLLLSFITAQAAPAPATNITFGNPNTLYPGRGVSFSYSARSPNPDTPNPNDFRLFYRAQSRGETQNTFPREDIVACANAFRARIQGFVTAGRAWDSELGAGRSPERDISQNGVFIWIKPNVIRILPVTLEYADGLLQTMIAAAQDTTIIPQGFVEEAYIDSSVAVEGHQFTLAPVRLASANQGANILATEYPGEETSIDSPYIDGVASSWSSR